MTIENKNWDRSRELLRRYKREVCTLLLIVERIWNLILINGPIEKVAAFAILLWRNNKSECVVSVENRNGKHVKSFGGISL